MSKRCLLLMVLSFCFAFPFCSQGEQIVAAPKQATDVLTPASSAVVAGDPVKAKIINSYYAAQETPAFNVFKSSIKGIMEEHGWIDDITASLQSNFGETVIECKIQNPVFQFDTFARYYMLDHDWNPVYRQEETALYYCTYTADNHVCGFVVVSYNGKTMEVLRLWQTDYLYDLRTNYDEIIAALAKTDIDLSTVQASRVGLQDTKKNRGDTIIRLVDGKGENYVCYFGDSIEIEKFTEQ